MNTSVTNDGPPFRPHGFVYEGFLLRLPKEVERMGYFLMTCFDAGSLCKKGLSIILCIKAIRAYNERVIRMSMMDLVRMKFGIHDGFPSESKLRESLIGWAKKCRKYLETSFLFPVAINDL